MYAHLPKQIITKKLNERALGTQMDFLVPAFKLVFNKEQMSQFILLINGFNSCFTREDLPTPNFNAPLEEILHPIFILNTFMYDVTIRFIDNDTGTFKILERSC